jgi:hypothetical protein
VGVKFADGFFEDASERASPASMNGGHDALFGISEKDGDAVGGLDCEEKAGAAGEGCVALAGFFGNGSEGPDDGRVNLFEGDEGELFGVEGSLKFLAVGEDVFAGIPLGEAEIEYSATIKIGNATGSGTKAVDEPRKFGERFELQDFQASDGLEMPGS